MILAGVIARIVSNSYLNVFQKILTKKGAKSSEVNFYTYLGLTLSGILLLPLFKINFCTELVLNFFVMGILGALGNYYIIKALSIGELSALAPINSYKPIVALFISFLCLGETPDAADLLGIGLILLGTCFIVKFGKNINKSAFLYRFLALIFSGSEAVFIKKIIILTNLPASFFLWAFSGFIFAFLFTLFAHKTPKMPSKKELALLILSVGVMQFSTNYVFSKMNVAPALALFQLSTIFSVFLGANIFKEQRFVKKLAASIIMVLGAVIIILI